MSDSKHDAQPPQRKPPLWRRRWFVIPSGLFLLLVVVGTLAGDPDEKGAATTADGASDTATPTATPTPTPTVSPAEAARAAADVLADNGNYVEAVATLDDAGLRSDADRVAKDGAASLYKRARAALKAKRYTRARAITTRARKLHRTAAIVGVIDTADTKIAEQRAAARERRRQARLARDRRACTSAEKHLVRTGSGTPAGCTDFAAQLAAREAEKQAEDATSQCDPNYAGACLDPNSPDYDCAGASGDGPDYTGLVRIVGADPYDLDRDGDGVACES
jgi:tetratricopeptide (TPR) repeat protein